MIKIARDKELIYMLAEIEKIKGTNSIINIVFSNCLFNEARELFQIKEYLCAIKVVSTEEKFLFYLVNDEDYLSISPERRYAVDVNYGGCNLIEEIDNLDLKIIEKTDYYIFYEIDEYTFAIANLILYKYPNRDIYFMDKNAHLFFENACNVKIVPDINEIVEKTSKRCLFVSNVDRRYDVNPFNDNVVNIFSSIVIMANICWARKRKSYGNNNKDKTILIIDYSKSLYLGGMGGINAIISDVLFYANKAKENGWIPIVELKNSQYMSDEVSDSWTCYFEQLSSMTCSEARKSFNVIEGSENGFTWTPSRILLSPMIDEYKVQFSDFMKEYFCDNIPHQFSPQNKILGVIARGSDLKKATSSKFLIEDFIESVLHKSSEYDYIFLATEDDDYLRKFQDVIGEKLFYINQKRISYDFDNKDYKLIASLLDIKNEDRTEFGRKYLLITYLLSKCNSLYTTINCGARQLALRWKEDEYDNDEIYYNKYRDVLKEKFYKKALVQKNISEIVNNNEKTIIYGIGKDARNYVYVQEENRKKIIFCDKRAKTEEILFKGIEVISPDKLCDYKDTPIIVSSTLYGKEIEIELLQLGFNKKNIILIEELIN